MRILILDTVFAGAHHTRFIALSKVEILAELQVLAPKKSKQMGKEEQLPIDLSLLLIKRKDNASFTDFIMHYHGEAF